MSEEVQALTKLIQSPMAAAADREAKLSDILTMNLSSLSQLQSHQSNISGPTSTLLTKPVSAEPTVLLSASTLADFTGQVERSMAGLRYMPTTVLPTTRGSSQRS